MIDLLSLVKSSSAYKIISQDKRAGRLSHAYLVVCSDQKYLDDYLKILAKLIMCQDMEPCENCRACKLIEQNAFVDCTFYPKNGESVVVEDVNSLIEASYIKPLESDKRLFVISKGQTMNLSSQNKLLKTLEEPPKNVHILIGATTEFAMLPTVKSRVKRLDINPFSSQKLFECLKEDCKDLDRLRFAISCSDNTLGQASALYLDETLKSTMELVLDILINMSSSSEVLEFSNKIVKSKLDISQIISVLELFLRDLLLLKLQSEDLVQNKQVVSQLSCAKGFNQGAIVYILDKITQAKIRKKFNANPTMLIEWLLFTILEGKFKWQKS